MCVYLDPDDGGVVHNAAEHGGFINFGLELRRLVDVVNMNSDLREKKNR